MTNAVGYENNPGGLSSAEARARLASCGPNAFATPAGPGLARRFLNQFKSALIYILLFALALDLAHWLHHGASEPPYSSIAIALILIFNAILGTYQELKAEDAIQKLTAMAAPRAWVMRDHALIEIPARDIVPGDVVRIEAGDRIPADGILVAGQGVMTDESILTGESLPIDKDAGAALSSGTLMVRAKGTMEVTRTGAASTIGRLAHMIGTIDASQTPLERRLGVFANQIALAILVIGGMLVAGGLMAEGPSKLGEIVLFSVALAVAAVPEGLPAVLTLTLALGVERLSTRKAVVRRLSAVEALGSVTVIATDKTGTLTENRLEVRALDAPDIERALQAMVLANDAEPASRTGDPLEVALLDFATRHGNDALETHAQTPRLTSRPFDSNAKFMRVTVADGSRRTSYVKGAPEVLIALSAMDEAERAAWTAKARHYAGEGYRVLALAWANGEWHDGERAPAGEPGTDGDLTFLGLVMLWDPPRAEVADALAKAISAGIRVVMITGDHPETARAVGAGIGIASPRVVTGSDLAHMSQAEVDAAVATTNLFARVAPEHKLQLVDALKRTGAVVAVTGDGVNDAPALKRADVGVAMGQRGSDVAREVSDIVLIDDNFATIVTAIEEGRSIYENIQKFIRFLFSTNLALILLMAAGLAAAFVLGLKDPVSGTVFLPLTAVQLLWINLIADGPPALALAFDRNPGVMEKPPRPAGASLLDDASLRFIVASGIIKAGGGLAFLVAMPQLGYALEETRTAVFLFESLMQLVFIYPARRTTLAPVSNAAVHGAVALGFAIQWGVVTVPALRTVLGLVPVTPDLAAVILAGVLLTWGAAEILANALRTPVRRGGLKV